MKRFVAALALLASVALCASPAFSATNTKTITFASHYSGHASLLIDNGHATISSVAGAGKNSLFGTSRVSGSGSALASQQCDPFGGKGSIVGRGNKITFVISRSMSQGCSNGSSGPVTVTFKGVAKATGGSGDATGASGSLKFSGTLKLGGTSGAQNGSFTVTLGGTLSVR